MTLYRPSKDEVKRGLPLAYVCAQLGIALDNNDSAVCPFHDDSSPSFHLFEGDDGNERWSCFPCNVPAADLFDLIMRKRGLTFSEALDVATEMYQRLPADYARPRAAATTQGADSWTDDVNTARAYQQMGKEYLGILALASGMYGGRDEQALTKWDRYLSTRWGWGFLNSTVYLPHWDATGQLTGCKLRRAGTAKQSLPGSRYPALYGAWVAPVPGQDTLLAEGETDIAWAGYQAAEEGIPLNLYALPSGAQGDASGDLISFLTTNTRGMIYLAFDPDEFKLRNDGTDQQPGVEATRRWLDAFAEAGVLDRVRICHLPLGRDLRDAKPSIRRLLANATRPLPNPRGEHAIEATDYGYIRYNNDGAPYRVAKWTFEPTAVLKGGDAPGYDGYLFAHKTARRTVLRLHDLQRNNRLDEWAAKHGLAFPGSPADASAIREYIMWRADTVPEVYQTDQVGMRDAPVEHKDTGRTFVMPAGQHFGKTPFLYAPTAKAADVSDQVLLPCEDEPDWIALRAFRGLNDRSVTDPLLAWLFAAGRRVEVSRFPLLYIAGSSGVGKSTLAELALRLMGSAMMADLSAITAFVLLKRLSASTSLPVFVDEYTRQSKRETRETFQGAVPAIYTGGWAERGQADLSTQQYHMTAPVIVAGEDTFVLDREIDRMIQIRPSRKGQNTKALAYIQNAPLQAIGHRYHRWLTGANLPPIQFTLSDRPAYNRAILEAGWQTLLDFTEAFAGYTTDMPDLSDGPDLSALDAQADEPRENAYDAAIIEGLPLRDTNGGPLVWADAEGRGTWVRPQALIGTLTRQAIDVELPGGSRALLNYYAERYPLRKNLTTQPPGPGPRVRATLIQGLDLDSTEEDE